MNGLKSNSAVPETTKCPQCGTPLPGGALTGLCPACLLAQGAASETVTQDRQPRFEPPTVAELASLFPHLEIYELIGKGGMGAVYKARQKQLDRLVALKILPPGSGSDAAFAERFTREARALARLNHPGIVTLYEFGQVPTSSSTSSATQRPQIPLYFFLMEFVDGVNLRQLLAHGRVSAREALAIVPQICDALQFAHDQGIVHRDVKPENILLDRRGRVKVADFGLAKIVAASQATSRSKGTHEIARQPEPSGPSGELTQAGKVMGTPQYMSPEQMEAPSEVDHRADIYALGVVFYQMLTGELPGKPLEPPSKKVLIDIRLDEVVLRALERKPDLRFQQAGLLKTQVETIALAARSGVLPGKVSWMYRGLDYKSKTTIFGLPLVNIAAGLDPATGKQRVARGIIGIGGIAKGVVAIGGMATGCFAFGGFAIGVMAFGGCAVGLLSFGGLALALIAALGGGAIGAIALGGGAVGYFAFGGGAFGVHVLDAMTKDPMAQQFFLPWANTLFRNLQWINAIVIVIGLGIGVGLPLWLQRNMESGLCDDPGAGPPSGPSDPPGVGPRTSTRIAFTAITLAMLVVFSAWGNAVAMVTAASVILISGILLFAQGRRRWTLLVALAAAGIATAVVLLVKRAPSAPDDLGEHQAVQQPIKSASGSLVVPRSYACIPRSRDVQFNLQVRRCG